MLGEGQKEIEQDAWAPFLGLDSRCDMLLHAGAALSLEGAGCRC